MTESDRSRLCTRAVNKFLDAAAAVREYQRSANCSAEEASVALVGVLFTDEDLQAAEDFRLALDAIAGT